MLAQLDDHVLKQIGIVAAGSVAGVVAIILALAKVGVFTRGIGTPPQVTAGQQTIEFWQNRFDRVEDALRTVDKALADNRGLIKDETKEIRDLLIDIDTNMKIMMSTSSRTDI